MFQSAYRFNQTWCAFEAEEPWHEKVGIKDFKNSQGSLFCCPPGKFHKPSSKLVPGSLYYESDVSADPFFCEACQLGKFTNVNNVRTTCDKCPRDFIAAGRGTAECGDCRPSNSFSNDRIECSKCGTGLHQYYGLVDTTCKNCTKAKYQDFSGQKECKYCPAGWYQGQEAKPFCLPCIPVRDSSP